MNGPLEEMRDIGSEIPISRAKCRFLREFDSELAFEADRETMEVLFAHALHQQHGQPDCVQYVGSMRERATKSA